MKNSMEVLQKIKNRTLCDPASPLLGLCPKEQKSGSHRYSCTPKLIAVLFTTAEMQKQSNFLSVDEGVNTFLNACFWWLPSRRAVKAVTSVPLSPPPSVYPQYTVAYIDACWLHISPMSKLTFRSHSLAGKGTLSIPTDQLRCLGTKTSRYSCEVMWPSSWPFPAAGRWSPYLTAHPQHEWFFLVIRLSQLIEVRKEPWIGSQETWVRAPRFRCCVNVINAL